MPSSSMELEAVLRRVERELVHLPRHEWDNYLWRLCSALVQSNGGSAVDAARIDIERRSDGGP